VRASRNVLAGALIAASAFTAAAPAVVTTAAAAAPAAAAPATAGLPDGGHRTTAGPVVQLGYRMAARPPYGWTGRQDTCLNWLWTQESDWSDVAANGGSDARGIAQKITGWSGDYQPGNAAAQIAWGLGYIADTPYGTHTPCGAWAHELADGWY
jgi:opacity protein-like surface antigen